MRKGKELDKRDAAHLKAQKLARQRDDNICQICGSRNHTAGHHTVDYQYGGKASVGNIVTLCNTCHKKVHNGTMDIFCFR